MKSATAKYASSCGIWKSEVLSGDRTMVVERMLKHLDAYYSCILVEVLLRSAAAGSDMASLTNRCSRYCWVRLELEW